MINDLGAAGAARKLLADHHELVVTPWLVRRGRPELTLEHAIGQPRWAELFTEAERAEAARRLARAGKSPARAGGGAGSGAAGHHPPGTDDEPADVQRGP